jgi:hypothetical protein
MVFIRHDIVRAVVALSVCEKLVEAGRRLERGCPIWRNFKLTDLVIVHPLAEEGLAVCRWALIDGEH